jgi:hypothetical protein
MLSILLRDSAIMLEMNASVIDSKPVSDLEAHSPTSMRVGLVIPQEAGWTCLLEPRPGLPYSGPSRGAAVRQRVYLTRSTHSIGTNPFKYVWDLDGKKVLILRNPGEAFWVPKALGKSKQFSTSKVNHFIPWMRPPTSSSLS